MKFIRADIEGACLIERQPSCDERGYFARLYCENEFAAAGLDIRFVQMNLCENRRRGTLRGLHFQAGDKAEHKVVSCLRGRIYDVCVDIRSQSPTFGRWAGYELSEENNRMFFIPKGCAHGYVTLEPDCQLLYLMSEFYAPGCDAGYRYDDPTFQIDWPVKDGLTLSEKDKRWPYYHK